MTKKVMFYLVFCHFVINFAVEMETMIAGYEMKKLSARTYRNGSAEILSCLKSATIIQYTIKGRFMSR